MSEPHFELGQEVHIAREHCPQCRKLETELKHPVRISAILPYAEVGFTYRIQDAAGRHYEVSERCLCTDPSGHSDSPCQHCGQAIE
jgi:hypothetical protein